MNNAKSSATGDGRAERRDSDVAPSSVAGDRERAKALSSRGYPSCGEVDRTRTSWAELELTKAILERKNHELEQFALVAAHELKAPLRGIALLSQSGDRDLDAHVPTATRREHLALLRERILRMEALIDGILGYARAGQISDVVTEVDLTVLLRDVLELLGAPDGVVGFDTAMPSLITARVPLQQVFMNLIGNALAHGRREGARVTIGAEERDGEWELYVADNGPGIPPRHQERIFNMFVTLSPDPTIGTGIGLAVVKKIVDGAGGRVWVESRSGHGATFRFRWPNRRAARYYPRPPR